MSPDFITVSHFSSYYWEHNNSQLVNFLKSLSEAYLKTQILK